MTRAIVLTLLVLGVGLAAAQEDLEAEITGVAIMGDHFADCYAEKIYFVEVNVTITNLVPDISTKFISECLLHESLHDNNGVFDIAQFVIAAPGTTQKKFTKLQQARFHFDTAPTNATLHDTFLGLTVVIKVAETDRVLATLATDSMDFKVTVRCPRCSISQHVPANAAFEATADWQFSYPEPFIWSVAQPFLMTVKVDVVSPSEEARVVIGCRWAADPVCNGGCEIERVFQGCKKTINADFQFDTPGYSYAAYRCAAIKCYLIVREMAGDGRLKEFHFEKSVRYDQNGEPAPLSD